MIPEAVQATHTGGPPGLVFLVWGVVASSTGLALLTNFRGFADNLAERRWQRSPFGRGPSPLMMRLLAIPFVILGPVGFVAGIVMISHGHITGLKW